MSNDIFSKYNGVISYVSALENFSNILKQYELSNIPSICIVEDTLKPLIDKINQQIETINLPIQINPIKLQWLYNVNDITSQTGLSFASYIKSYEIDVYLKLNLYGVVARDAGYIVRTKGINIDEAFEKALPVKINKLAISIMKKLTN